MKITSIAARSLARDLLPKWAALQQSNHHLASPFFCPEYTAAIAGAREDVFVGLLEQAGEVVGFFPFQRARRTLGQPVGWPMCDYQAVVAAPDAVWDAEELLRGCGLEIWDFDHLLLSQSPFTIFHRLRRESPIVNLAGDSGAYFRQNQILVELSRKTRKLEREIGPVRFVPQLADHATLDRLLGWWSRKWTGEDQVGNWHRDAFHTILDTQTDRFAGMLSALYAGDQLAAVSFGMRSRTVWHYWFPAYDSDLARYSPGATLLLQMIAAAPSLGITTLDMGVGDEPYKRRLRNDAIPVVEGTASLTSLAARTTRFRWKLEGEIRQHPRLQAGIKSTTTALRSIRHIFGV
jgi:CelD/BcsL family acetyltransferase involved in cellulose biosynthesis